MQSSIVTPSPLSIEQRVIRLRGWQADGRDQEVLTETSDLLGTLPENRDIN
jgi:hypothetical protein